MMILLWLMASTTTVVASGSGMTKHAFYEKLATEVELPSEKIWKTTTVSSNIKCSAIAGQAGSLMFGSSKETDSDDLTCSLFNLDEKYSLQEYELTPSNEEGTVWYRQNSQRVPPPSIAFGSQLLTFSAEDDKLSWDEAAAACAGNGGRLATLNQPEGVYDYLTANYDGGISFWTGASDAANEGSWVWMSGQPLGDQFPWASGHSQPNGGTEQNCLRVSDGYGYFDDPCSATKRYICEVGDSFGK